MAKNKINDDDEDEGEDDNEELLLEEALFGRDFLNDHGDDQPIEVL